MPATPAEPGDVPIRSRLVLVCGIGLASLTVLAVLIAMVVALAR